MKIAVNTRWLIPDKCEGFGWYTQHVLKRLTNNMRDAQFVFFTDRKPSSYLVENLNVQYKTVYPPARHPYLWYVWNEISIPFMLKKTGADLYFSPDGFLPSGIKIPSIATIHDLNFEDEPSYLSPRVQAYYKKYMRLSANAASHILTVSDFSKKDLETRYQIASGKVTAVHNGPQKKFENLRKMKVSTQQRYGRNKPYFLFVGAQNPRKNMHRILAAFDALKSKTNLQHKLLFVGEKMRWDENINAAWEKMSHQEDVIFTGRLSTTELNKVYSAATALVFPSLHEGFGMPIIEAFAAHCPVITSTTTAMPEVAGNAALLVNPTETSAIEKAMQNLAESLPLREELREKGAARAKDFKWNKVAKTTEKIIQNLLDA